MQEDNKQQVEDEKTPEQQAHEILLDLVMRVTALEQVLLNKFVLTDKDYNAELLKVRDKLLKKVEEELNNA